MRNSVLTLMAFAAIGTASCTNATESTPVPLTEKQTQKLDKALKGKVAGKPVSCISSRNSSNFTRISDDMLLYRQSGNLVYQNNLRNKCPGLGDDYDIIVVKSFNGSQLCRGDWITLVDRLGGIPGPTCVLGEFVPFTKAGEED